MERAHADGMLPVISYKVGGDVPAPWPASWNAVAEQAATQLASFGLPTAVTFWHEPNGDLSPADYVAASKQILPAFKRDALRVGPILNGWLLDNQLATFGAFSPDEMFGLWDWVGIDAYEGGTAESPGRAPRTGSTPCPNYVTARGFSLPLGVGEYNGYSASSIANAGEALLSIPNVWFGCVWNAHGGRRLGAQR